MSASMPASERPKQSLEPTTDPQQSQRGVARARAQQQPFMSQRALASLVATTLFSMVIVFAFAAIGHAHALGAARPTPHAESLLMSIGLPLVAGAISGAIVVWLKRPRGARRR